METVGAYEAKTHLPKLLDKVSRGEQIVITRHGMPVAVLQQPGPVPAGDVRETIAALRKFRSDKYLGNDSLRNMIEEGRR